ncbi:hypothetical protein [Actinomadura hibisca]|uniref:hypothetical protein n=1 Tax=Actinomadura hibisca TaxID=68565 RepID=UPI00082FBE3A|nr:hypothetical protein [Actinomadura hibisca]
MHPTNSTNQVRKSRNHKHEVTYKIQVWEWISVRHGSQGDTFRVVWLVAGHRRGRNFRSYSLAKAFQDMLVVASGEGQPFDTRTGMPLSIAARPRRKTRRRRHENVEGLLD